MTYYLEVTREYGLGRVPFKHPRQVVYPMTALLPEVLPPRRYRYWNLNGPYLDQGPDGACCGFAWSHFLNAGPITHRPPLTNSQAFELYKEAQKNDEWPTEDYVGSSVNGGALAVRARGHISEFRWAWDAETAILAVLHLGPVVLGTNWYDGMFEPNSKGFLEVTGPLAGGHAYLLVGANVETKTAKIRNSWGKAWGKSGTALLHFADLDRLIKEQGEACIATELSLSQKKVDTLPPVA